jgi:hypothetical protein
MAKMNPRPKRILRGERVSSRSSGERQAGGRRCGLCGGTEKLTRTECCGQWICDDEDQYQLFSYARNSCYRNHQRFTLCGSHFTEGHEGKWQHCPKCREAVPTEMYVYYGTNEYNFETLPDPPAYEPTHCTKCSKVIKLGEGGYSRKGGDYLCMDCVDPTLKAFMTMGLG